MRTAKVAPLSMVSVKMESETDLSSHVFKENDNLQLRRVPSLDLQQSQLPQQSQQHPHSSSLSQLDITATKLMDNPLDPIFPIHPQELSNTHRQKPKIIRNSSNNNSSNRNTKENLVEPKLSTPHKLTQLIQQQSDNTLVKIAPPVDAIQTLYDKASNPSSRGTTTDPVCRVCLVSLSDSGGTLEASGLLSLCQCRGSIQYIHFDCLKYTLEYKFGKTAEMANSIGPSRSKQTNPEIKKQRIRRNGVKNYPCELCAVEYSVSWSRRYIRRSCQVIKAKKKLNLLATFASFIFLVASSVGAIYYGLQSQDKSTKIEDSMLNLMYMIILGFSSLIALAYFIAFTFKVFWVRLFVIESISAKPYPPV